MKLLRKSAVLLAVAAAAMLVSAAIEVGAPAAASAPAHGRMPANDAAGHDGRHPHINEIGFTPPDASWGGVFNGNWR